MAPVLKQTGKQCMCKKKYVIYGANDSAANDSVVHLWTWYTKHK